MRTPCPASLDGVCLELAEGYEACHDDDCDREGEAEEETGDAG